MYQDVLSLGHFIFLFHVVVSLYFLFLVIVHVGHQLIDLSFVYFGAVLVDFWVEGVFSIHDLLLLLL